MSKQGEEEFKAMTSLEKLSRRSFLSRAGAMSIASATAAIASPANAATEKTAKPEPTGVAGVMPGMIPVTLKVNGEEHRVRIDSRATVLDTLRETLQLTGTKKGCDHGQCGACTIHVDGQRANSCLLFAAMQQGKEITTIEGIGTPEKMHPMQAAFVAHDSYQCGYCTSGQIMSATAMLHEPWGAEDNDVQEALSGNICRCGAYPNIVAAVQACRRNGVL
ncbi:MAG: (2Fe-2S)-binding protein [Acidobacteriaceae bacterium]|nr:(2Fe-2S)-binding protein [Acidobacteriaceae bacterium]